MKVSAVVLATSAYAQENWDICPSDHTNDNGCYTQDVGWVVGRDVNCEMTNKNCMSVSCSAGSITADLRADLFHTNLKNEDTFMKQLEDKHRTLERTNNPGVPLEQGAMCGFEVTSTGVKLNAWSYELCGISPTMNSEGEIVYSVSIISPGNAPGIPTIEFYVDTTVEASCKYNSTVVVDADGFWINQEDVEVARANQGDLRDTMDCKFYADSEYKNQIGGNNLVNMGQTIYGRVESAALAGLSYDLVGVTVTNANDLDMSYPVIANSVPDTTVNAISDGSAETGQNVNFSYWSFGFETATGTDQNQLNIECAIELKLTNNESEHSLPAGYTEHQTTWGTVWTKIYDDHYTWEEGKALCAADGDFLHMPIPENMEQNDFYFNLVGSNGNPNFQFDRDLWLDINDEENEGE